MPGSNQKAMNKGKTIPADCLIFDLEDAVSPSMKVEARKMVVDQTLMKGYGLREICIRVNGLDTEWGESDIAAACQSGCDAIALPKVESAEQILRATQLMNECGAPPHTALWALLETPRGILAADEICGAHEQLNCIIMGTSDLSKELNSLSRRALLTSLQLVVLAAKKYKKCVLDGVYLNIQDLVGFEAECNEGKSFGFDGKTLIHPSTIDISNRVFSPSVSDVEDAVNIVQCFDAALKEGKGCATYKGRLIENLHADSAKKLLDLHEMIKRMESA